MSATKGKPFCKAAGRFLKEEHSQCQACLFIVYVGCPSFQGKFGHHKKAKEYLRWLYGEKNILVASGELPPPKSTSKAVNLG